MADLKNVTNKETAEGKSFRTVLQAGFGVITAFFAGLWALPGVPEYVTEFARTEGLAFVVFLLGFVGIPAGLLAFFMNRKSR